MDKVTRLSTDHNLFEEKGDPKRYQTRGPSAYQPNAFAARPNRLIAIQKDAEWFLSWEITKEI